MKSKILTIAVLASALTTSHAQSTWTGANGTLWSDNANWSTPPAANSTLTFAGNTNTTTTNDFPADTQFGAITFQNSTTIGNFTLSGNSIKLNGTLSMDAAPVNATLHTVNLDLQLVGNRTVTTRNGGNIAIYGNITEDAAGRTLTKNGQGTLFLYGNNSFTGTLFQAQTALQINTLADAGVACAAGAGASLQVGSTNSAGTLILNASSDQSTNRTVLIGGNTTTGTHTGGAVISNNSPATASTLTFTNADFNLAQGSVTANRTLTLGGTNNGTNTIQGVIRDNSASGIVSLTKADAGKWALAGNNTYSGGTSITGGTLAITSDANLGNASGNLTLGTAILLFNDNVTLSATRAISVTSPGGSEFNIISGKTVVFNGTLTGAGGVKKSSAGILDLSNSNNNTFANIIQVLAGTYRAGKLADTGVPSSIGQNATYMQLGNAGGTGTLEYVGAGDSTNKQVQIGGGVADNSGYTGSARIYNDGTGALSFTNATFNRYQTGNTTANRTLTLGGDHTGNNTILGVITNNKWDGNSTDGSGGGVVTLVKEGNGTWFLAANNTFTGPTTVKGGILRVGGDDALSENATLTVNDGTLDFNGFNQTISTASNFASMGGVAGASPVIDTGNGTLTLNDADLSGITYSATNNPNGGVINGNVVMNPGNNNFAFAAGDSANAAIDLTVNAVLSKGGTLDAGTFYTNSSGVLLLNGNNTFDMGSLQNRAGTWVLGVNDTVDTDTANPGTVSGALGENDENVQVGYDTNTNATAALLLRDGVTTNRPVTIGDETDSATPLTRTLGGFDTTGNAEFSGGITMNNDGAGIASAQTILAAPGTSTVTFSGVITDGSATVSLEKTGNGTVVLSNNNTYDGNTTVAEGALRLASGNAIPDANTLVINGGVVDLSANETVGILILGNATQGNSTYGSTSSAATVQDDTYFSGNGILTVGDGGGAPAVSFTTWAAFYGLNGSLTDNFDTDKFSDGEEYAYDLDPTVDELGNVLASQTTLAGGNVTLTLAFSGNSAKSDINYVVRRANNPAFTANTVVGHWNGTANWTTSNSTYFTNQTQTGAGDVKDINVNLALPAASEPRQFLKVDIE